MLITEDHPLATSFLIHQLTCDGRNPR